MKAAMGRVRTQAPRRRVAVEATTALVIRSGRAGLPGWVGSGTRPLWSDHWSMVLDRPNTCPSFNGPSFSLLDVRKNPSTTATSPNMPPRTEVPEDARHAVPGSREAVVKWA